MNIITFRTQNQRWLWENILKGQVSDGWFEEVETDTRFWYADTDVDPDRYGINFDALANFYFSSDFFTDMDDWILEQAQKEFGDDYNLANLRGDLLEIDVTLRYLRIE